MKMNSHFSTVALFAGIAFGSASAFAAPVQIDFGDRATVDLNTVFGGAQYPTQGGSTVTINGVDFKLPTCVNCSGALPQNGTNGNLDVVNGPNGHPGIIGTTGPTGPVQALPITFSPIVGATSVYMLVNSFYGVITDPPSAIGSITFVSEAGFTFQYNLIEGFNIRDHYHGIYNNVIDADNLLGTAVFKDGAIDPNGDPDGPGVLRLDALRILLPVEFLTDPLVSIVLATEGDPGKGLPFWAAAVTIDNAAPPEVVPVPAAWSLMLAGLGGVWMSLRRNRKRHSAQTQAA